MPIEIKHYPGEAILSVTITNPFEPEHEMPAMFGQFMQLRHTTKGVVALILDLSDTINKPDEFSNMVSALAQAGKNIKASKIAGLEPPIIIIVGSGPMVDLASRAITQEQYGGAGTHLCSSRDEALALAREKLAPPA
ncbi:MAG: hypothetical protein JXA10_00870 [Anaerolineae bacterium]|nr:hypothetical protein [Anaerolineae bacterium]